MAYAMNMGDFIFGMGTFVTPLIIIYCARRFGLMRTLYGFAAVSVIPLLLGLGVDWEALTVAATDSVAGGLVKLLSDPIVWLCSLAFFFHVPTEASLALWATTLMTDKKVDESKASALLSLFWLTFMGSRLVTALTLAEGADTTLVVVMAGCSIAITLAIVLCRGARLMCILIVAAGAIVGPIFPTLIAILLGHVEPSLHGRAVGIFFCIGGIGWTVIPILIGRYAKRTTVQRAFLLASGSAVLLFALSIVLALRLT
jgi:fucose permease